MRTKTLFAATAVTFSVIAGTSAFASTATISTSFDLDDGFVTGDFGDVTLSAGSGFEVTFSGGQQQQMFDLASYNSVPAGFLFVNGPFTGASGNTITGDGIDDDSGLIDFSTGASEVSFFAANRANGAATTLNVFATDDVTLLGSVAITQTSNQLSDGAIATVLRASDFGGAIGSIGIDLPGPVANPPYALAIDSFEVTAVPIPAPILMMLAAFTGLFALPIASRRRKGAV